MQIETKCLQIYLSFLVIIDTKTVSRKFLSLINLPKAKTLSIHKLLKVVVIIKNKDLIFIAFQVVVLCLKSFKDSQQLLIIFFVPYLYRNHFSKEKNYHILLNNFGHKRNQIFINHVIKKMLIRIIQSHLTEDSTNNIS